MRNRKNIVNEFKNIQLSSEMHAPMTAMEYVGRFIASVEIAYSKNEISDIELSLLTSIYIKTRRKITMEIIKEYKGVK